MRSATITAAFLSAAVLSTALTAGAAQAGPHHTPGVDERQWRQERRIDNGVANGSLTAAEAARLAAGQARVDRMESRFKSDGVVTGWERARLHGAQDRQSRKIYRKKHNLRWR